MVPSCIVFRSDVDVRIGVQVALEGSVSKEAAMNTLALGQQPQVPCFTDMTVHVPWYTHKSVPV